MIRYGLLNPRMISSVDVADVNKLLRQFSDSAVPVTAARLSEAANKSLVVVALNTETGRDRIRGMATLSIAVNPLRRVGHLDAVIVAESLRGKGVGRGMVNYLIDWVRVRHLADRIELTCRPSREPANSMYQKLGFEQRETNNYVMKF